MTQQQAYVAAYREGMDARQAGWTRSENPRIDSQLRAAWNRGWDEKQRQIDEEPQDAFSYANSESDSGDHHQQTWNLAEALSEIVRGEVEKQVRASLETPDPLTHEWVVQQIRSELENWSSSTADAIESLKEKAEHLFICQHKAEQRLLELESVDGRTGEILDRELGPSWMDRIEDLERDHAGRFGRFRDRFDALEQRVDANYSTAVDLQEKVQIVEERISCIDESLDTNWEKLENAEQRVSDLEEREECSARGIRDNETRIEDIETTLERPEGPSKDEDESAYEHFTGDVSRALVKLGDLLFGMEGHKDDHVEWVGQPPAAGPWKEGKPPKFELNTWLVRCGRHAFMYEDIESKKLQITHHARIHLPETESED